MEFRGNSWRALLNSVLGEKAAFEKEVPMMELSAAVNQMASGWVQPLTFSNGFGILSDTISWSKRKGSPLPVSCQRTILSFLPQNCNLALLNNQRPVALLCSNYKTLTDTQGSTWKHFPNKPELLCCDQDSYGYMNIFFSFRAVIDMCTFYNLNTGVLSLD